ncbi:MAG: hypothetical protein K2W95_18145 [Candidatus Obscuribacterales bacterium]|nr:hypothetical protein [Candidatus Obscuribacterales bacterium]
MISLAPTIQYLKCSICYMADQRERLRTMRLVCQAHSLQKHADFLDRIHADSAIFEHERAARYCALRYWTEHKYCCAPAVNTMVLLQYVEHLKPVSQNWGALSDFETDWLSGTTGSSSKQQ